jgi:prepilin-type N-terminal cleavage/methylation domain-containing protein
MNFLPTLKQLQKGFTLLELSITTTLIGMGIVALITMQIHQNQVEAARGIAKIYERLNNAAGSYMSNYYGLIIKLDPRCSRVAAQVGSPPAANPAINCNLQIPQNNAGPIIAVQNGLQPTTAELRRLGFLSGAETAQNENSLPLPTFARGGRFQALSPAGAPVPERFAIAIQFMCVGQPGGPVQITSSAECISRSYDLRSLVFNSQPYKLGTSSLTTDTLLDHILMAAGADAFLSDLTNGNLRAMAGAAVQNINNPVTWNDGNQIRGAPYILAIVNGFGSSGFDQMVRRDGTMALTSDWNVSKDQNNISITGVNNLGAATVTASQGGIFGNFGSQSIDNIVAALKATTVYISESLKIAGSLEVEGSSTFKGSSTFNNNVKVNAPAEFDGATTFNKNVKVNGASDFAGASTFGSSVSVNGASGFAGPATFDNTVKVNGAANFAGMSTFDALIKGNAGADLNKVTAGDVHLKNSTTLGARCDPSVETFRPVTVGSSDFANGFRIAVCDGANRTWTSAQADLSGAVAGLSSSINSVSETVNTGLSNVNAGLSNVNAGLSNVNSAVATINNELTRLDANIQVLEQGVTKLNNNFMRWDVINVDYPSATCTKTVEDRGTFCVEFTAKSKVWRKTPWQCNPLGTNNVQAIDGVRWVENASDLQKAGPAKNSSTTPILVGLDEIPTNDSWVYDINCVSASQTGATHSSGSYWYIGVSVVNQNLRNGNSCRSGLGGPLSFETMKTYRIETNSCDNLSLNLLNPNFSTARIGARFMAFTTVN